MLFLLRHVCLCHCITGNRVLLLLYVKLSLNFIPNILSWSKLDYISQTITDYFIYVSVKFVLVEKFYLFVVEGKTYSFKNTKKKNTFSMKIFGAKKQKV